LRVITETITAYSGIQIAGAVVTKVDEVSSIGPTISGLQGRARNPEPVLRIFEKRLLEAIGYGLVLDRDPETGDAIDTGQRYRYRIGSGPCRGGMDSEPAVVVSGRTLKALNAESLSTQQALREAKRLMRHVLSHYLGERPLASRDLFTTSASA